MNVFVHYPNGKSDELVGIERILIYNNEVTLFHETDDENNLKEYIDLNDVRKIEALN